MIKTHLVHAAIVIVIFGFVNSAPPRVPNSNEIEEDAEYIPAESYISFADYYCSQDQHLSEIKSFVTFDRSCQGTENDTEYWTAMCRCSIDPNQDCPQCSEAERSIHEIPHEGSTSHNRNLSVHVPSPRLANLVIRKTPEPEAHNKLVRHGVAANATNFIRFG